MKVKSFEETTYWQDRLSDSRDPVTLVGHRALGPEWNRAIYARRYQVLQALIENQRLTAGLKILRVADCGAGFGLFWPFWRDLGVQDYLALELSQEAVRYLREEFSKDEPRTRARAVQVNLVEESTMSKCTDRTIVTFLDVLYHIVDDEEFARALAAGWNMLEEGGTLVFADCLGERAFSSGSHVRFRPLALYGKVLGKQISAFQVFPLFLTLVPAEPFTFWHRMVRPLWGIPAILSKISPAVDKVCARGFLSLDQAIFSRWPRCRSLSSSLVTVRK